MKYLTELHYHFHYLRLWFVIKKIVECSEWFGSRGWVSFDVGLEVCFGTFVWKCHFFGKDRVALTHPHPLLLQSTQTLLAASPTGTLPMVTSKRTSGGGEGARAKWSRSTRAAVVDGTVAAPALFDKDWSHLKVSASFFVPLRYILASHHFTNSLLFLLLLFLQPSATRGCDKEEGAAVSTPTLKTKPPANTSHGK